ncbi:MAG: hypothetical protein MUE40_10850 [Anaerolineae bacterium]|jgi:uncharacterized protein YdcH (DUF465 family)|nr:hypothetical protein [Anaerolineae bacterium]
MSESSELQGQIAIYRRLVERYEQLNAAIQQLINSAREGSGSKELSPENLKHYRQMARERDEVFSEMRALQHQLMADDSSEFTITGEDDR